MCDECEWLMIQREIDAENDHINFIEAELFRTVGKPESVMWMPASSVREAV